MHTHVHALAPKAPRATWSVSETLPRSKTLLNKQKLEALCRRATLKVPDERMLYEMEPLVQIMESVRVAKIESLSPEPKCTQDVPSSPPGAGDGTGTLPRDVLLGAAPRRIRAGFFVAP